MLTLVSIHFFIYIGLRLILIHGTPSRRPGRVAFYHQIAGSLSIAARAVPIPAVAQLTWERA